MSLYVSFPMIDAELCIYHLFVWSNSNFLHNSSGLPLPTQYCLVLCSLCTNLLHSLIMWLIVSSLSPHNLHLIFCCVLFIVALIGFILIALLCSAIITDSISLLMFSFLSHDYVFSWKMSFVSRLNRLYICFSSHFCFLVNLVLLIFVLSVLFLMDLIRLPSRFSVLYSSRFIDAMKYVLLSPPFFFFYFPLLFPFFPLFLFYLF